MSMFQMVKNEDVHHKEEIRRGGTEPIPRAKS